MSTVDPCRGEVCNRAGRGRDGKTRHLSPIRFRHHTAMNADIRTSALFAARYRELEDIRFNVPETMQRSRGSVRDDRDTRSDNALMRRHLRVEREPCRLQAAMPIKRNSGNHIQAMLKSYQRALLSEPSQLRCRDAQAASLWRGQQTPL